MHVFEDLQPYICTAADCPDILTTFASRKEWSNHEFSKHRCKTSYRCHSCSEDFASRNDCLDHYASVHAVTDMRHTLAMLAAATTTVADPIAKQKCPLCGEAGWASQRKFVTHVGRHMEDVALSSLPREIDSDDSLTESGSEYVPLPTQSKTEAVMEYSRFESQDLIAQHERMTFQGLARLNQGEEIGRDDARPDVTDPDSSEFQAVEKGICPFPGCGKVSMDLKAHMLIHQLERPFKCLFQTCEYHLKGFVRGYDLNRHLLTHFKGTMVCGYCGGGFNLVVVFKRHLISVHAVEPTPPNSRKSTSTVAKPKTLSEYGPGATGQCTNCSQIFADAQDFYQHLDACTMAVIKRYLSRGNDATHPTVSNDREVQDAFDKHLLGTDQSPHSELEEDVDDDDEEEEKEEEKLYEADDEDKKGAVSPARKGRRWRKSYPASWGFDSEKLPMKKRVLCAYDGERRLYYSDHKPQNDEFGSRGSSSAFAGQTSVTDLDILTLQRAEAFQHASHEDQSIAQLETQDEIDLNKLMSY